MIYEFNIKPVPKPRETQRDKWNPRPGVQRFRAYRDEVILRANQLNFIQPDAGSKVIFIIPMPKSYSKKKKDLLDGRGHQLRPDVDNLLKAWLDSVCKSGDEHVYDIHPVKVWGREGKIEVIVS